MLLKLYEKNNNPQDLQQVVDILNDGGLIIYPTDTMYAIIQPFSKLTGIEIFNGKILILSHKISQLFG